MRNLIILMKVQAVVDPWMNNLKSLKKENIKERKMSSMKQKENGKKRFFLIAILFFVFLQGVFVSGELVRKDINSKQKENSFSFLYLADENQPQYQKAIRHAYDSYPDLAFILAIPDNGSWGASREDNYKRYAAEWLKNPKADPKFVPIFMGLGNHDIESPVTVDWTVKKLGPSLSLLLPGMRNFKEGPFDVYPEHDNYEDRYLNYSFDYKNSHFVMYNIYFHDILQGKDRFAKGYAPKGEVNDDILKWLEEDLKKTDAKFKFLVYHEGAYPPPGARHEGDSLDVNPKMRDKFWNILAKYDVTACLVGHNHSPAQTWAKDPSEKYGAVYELEPGHAANDVYSLVVNIDNDKATIRNYVKVQEEKEFKEVCEPIIVDKSPVQTNYPVRLYQHSALYEKNYPRVDKTEYLFEAGETIKKNDGLYFEANDNNIRDNISFSYEGLPEYFILNDWSSQFRRVSLVTRKLETSDIGSRSFRITASDGVTKDSVNVKATVLPSEKPAVAGFTIKEGSDHRALKRIRYFIRDNVKLSIGRVEQYFKVKINGEFSKNFSTRNYGKFSDDFAYIGIIPKEGVFAPGAYEITATCADRKGNISEPAVLKFNVVSETTAMEDTVPWVDGTYPCDGAVVKSLKKIGVMVNSFSGRNSIYANSKLEFSKNGQPVLFKRTENPNQYEASWGDLDLVFDQPLPPGVYNLKVTPVVAKNEKKIEGIPHFATITIEK
ncbi:MAG: hypothetical protein A2044_06115 [Candidatus Firestonebacteria bacterium GWA2_43_8]|nr:MAG: hypothetical protein A2044_06115 [Candidatus Firestonebacteria bacterium GWA2_43_8]